LAQALLVRTLLFPASLLPALALSTFTAHLQAQTPAIDAKKAKQYFEEAKALSEKDNGALWKVQLRGPLLFVGPETR